MWHRYIVALNPFCALFFKNFARHPELFDELQDLSNKHSYSHMFSLQPAIVPVKLAVKVAVKVAIKVAAKVAVKLTVKVAEKQKVRMSLMGLLGLYRTCTAIHFYLALPLTNWHCHFII